MNLLGPLVPSMCPPAHASAASESRRSSKLLIWKILIGAEGQNRTADTVIFSHVLYQLSYLGTAGSQRALEPRNHNRACHQPQIPTLRAARRFAIAKNGSRRCGSAHR